MAAVTVTNRQEHMLGSLLAVCATVTVQNNGDTWNTNKGRVLYLSVDATTAVAIGATKSGGTITFAISAGPVTADVIALCRR